MSLTKEDLQAIKALMQEETTPINQQFNQFLEQQQEHTSSINQLSEQQVVHTKSIMTLENKVMHELKLLNENLPDVIARHEELNDLREDVDDHDNRIFALEGSA